ncbi:hypothetical protein FACS1894102_4410 [Spirochaetia bacterium]|nr:hypothetical protein FACS1894102_4410 [Spirochaetia bacterium]
MERLNPLDNYLFMKAFGEKGREPQLLAFLKSILKRTKRDDISSVEILEDKTLSAEIIGNKTGILDVRAKTNKGDNINIEVQLKDLHNMDRRSLFYWGKQYMKDIEAGDNYKNLPDVIAVNIVNFDFIPLADFHTSFHLREDMSNNYILTNAIEIHFINMVRFRQLKEIDIVNNELERWLAYLNTNTSPDLIEEVIKMDAAIRQTNECYKFILQDKDTLHRYHLNQIAQMDLNNVVSDRDAYRAARDAALATIADHKATIADREADRDAALAALADRDAALAEAARRIAELEAQ